MEVSIFATTKVFCTHAKKGNWFTGSGLTSNCWKRLLEVNKLRCLCVVVFSFVSLFFNRKLCLANKVKFLTIFCQSFPWPQTTETKVLVVFYIYEFPIGHGIRASDDDDGVMPRPLVWHHQLVNRFLKVLMPTLAWRFFLLFSPLQIRIYDKSSVSSQSAKARWNSLKPWVLVHYGVSSKDTWVPRAMQVHDDGLKINSEIKNLSLIK